MRRFVCRLGLAAGAGVAGWFGAPAAHAQLVPDGVTDPPLVAVPPADTLVGVRLHARRIGVSTYTQQSEAYGHWHLGRRHTLLYRARTDWVLDSRGRPPFVREDYRADMLHLIGLGRHWQVGQQAIYDYSHANHIRTVT